MLSFVLPDRLPHFVVLHPAVVERPVVDEEAGAAEVCSLDLLERNAIGVVLDDGVAAS